MPRRTSTAVLQPNLGLYFDRPLVSIPLGGLQDGLNFRIKNGKLSNLNLGWTRFGTFTLNGPVTLIDNFFLSSGAQVLIFGTTKDLYEYDEGTETVLFLTPRYETGTVAVTNGANTIVGTGTTWTANLKAGDQIAFGAVGIRTPDYATNGGWYTIATVTDNTHITLTTNFTGSTQSGIAYTGRKLFTARLTEPWETETFINAGPSGDDELFLTNGVDPVCRWNGTDTQVTLLTSLNFTAKHLLTFSNMMIYGNITAGGANKPTTIINSHVGEPANVTTGLASEFVIHDGTDPILALLTLGDTMVAYSGRHCVLGQFVGDPLIFTFRTGLAGIGPIAGRLVADYGDYHEFIGTDSAYSFDGVTVQETAGHVWREVLRTRDPDRSEVAFAHFDEENGDLIQVVPLTSDPGAGSGTDVPPATAFSAHYLEQVGLRDPTPHSKRQFPFTASGFFERQSTLTWDQITQTWAELNFRWNDQFFLAAFPFNLVGDFAGKIYTLNTSQNGDGTALRSFVRFGRRIAGDGKMRALIWRIYPFVAQFLGKSLNVTLRLADHASGPVTDGETLVFDLGLAEGEYFVSPFRRARYFEVEFGTDGPDAPWEIDGYDVDARAGGRR